MTIDMTILNPRIIISITKMGNILFSGTNTLIKPTTCVKKFSPAENPDAKEIMGKPLRILEKRNMIPSLIISATALSALFALVIFNPCFRYCSVGDSGKDSGNPPVQVPEEHKPCDTNNN